MLIQNGGIFRDVTEDLFEKKFKAQGYVVVEQSTITAEDEEKSLTKKEIVETLNAMGAEFDGRASKSDLMDILRGLQDDND